MTALISIAAIGAAIALGYFRRINIGMVSIAFAFLIGRFLAGIPAATIVSGWPLNLFFMLLGMTLLFGIARVNGTLAVIAEKIIAATGGRRALIPPVFFGMSMVLAASGAGNISVCALVLPIAMTVSSQYRITPLLMATMVIAGANAGGLSPISPTGIIATTLADELGLDIGMRVFYRQIAGQTLLAATLYLILGGHRLERADARTSTDSPTSDNGKVAAQPADALGIPTTFDRPRIITATVFLLVVAAIVFGKWDIGLTAFLGSVTLLLLGAADEKRAIESVPWATLILVSGVGMLVRVAESAGGISMMADFLTKLMNEQSAPPIMAVIGGMLSIVSSASGVVMPTLIPTVPELVARIGGDPVHLISAIIIGAHVVTNSPFSTLGALAVSSAGDHVDKDKFFKNLLLFALAGLAYAALIVYLGIA